MQTNQQINVTELSKIVDQVIDYVESLKDDGVKEVKLSADIPPKAGAAAAGSAVEGLKEIARIISGCAKCALHKTRTRTVPGQGNPNPKIMFIGEAPGEDEDRQGLAFVGRAGQLLTKIIEGMGYSRQDVFIANILKCRPPNNRKPLPEETETCLPYLREQVAMLKPKVIVALGGTALESLIGTTVRITRMRGGWLEFEGIPLMPTFHPSYLLRNASGKKDVWSDMKAVLEHLGESPPKAKK